MMKDKYCEAELLVVLARLVLIIRDETFLTNDRYILDKAAHYLKQYAALLDQTPSLPSRREAASV